MKYEVIGWTYCGNDEFPPHEDITASVDFAVIEEIRKHKYLFGGDAHEDYCPVLNDGTCADYSWRGWGRIIALAYGVEGEYSYMGAYMDRCIKPEARKYPDTDSYPDVSRIVPKESLVEVFEMHLTDEMFEKVKAGTKTVELRLFDGKRKRVDIGDYIEFIKQSDETQRTVRRVVDLRPYETFEKLFRLRVCKEEEASAWGKFTPEQAGMPADADKDALVNAMYGYYDRAQEKEHGVIAFWLETPKHSCRTKFKVLIDDILSVEKYSELLAKADGEELRRQLDERFDKDLIEDALEDISSGFTRRWNGFEYGENTDYDVDVNVMIRKTLGGLFGAEKKLKAIQIGYCAPMRLEVFATIVKDSEEPKQLLSLDRDVIEFLHKSGVQLKLDYKVV